jgi:hypothetical protein
LLHLSIFSKYSHHVDGGGGNSGGDSEGGGTSGDTCALSFNESSTWLSRAGVEVGGGLSGGFTVNGNFDVRKGSGTIVNAGFESGVFTSRFFSGPNSAA